MARDSLAVSVAKDWPSGSQTLTSGWKCLWDTQQVNERKEENLTSDSGRSLCSITPLQDHELGVGGVTDSPRWALPSVCL